MGFKNGDKIISLDEISVEKFHEIQVIMARNQSKSAVVERGDTIITIELDQSLLPKVLTTPGMFTIRIPFEIASIPDTTQNAQKGLMPGDRIVAIDSIEVSIVQDVQQMLQERKGLIIAATIQRQGALYTKELQVDNEGRLGIVLEGDISKFFNVTTQDYTLFASIPAGFSKATSTIGNYFKELGLIFSPKTEAYKSVGSFISIGKIFPSSWQWEIFWNITAWLSIMLAVVNLLPIPALDGGHILFLIFEIITGKKPSDKFLEYAQVAGMIILFGIMFLAFGNDIYRLFK